MSTPVNGTIIEPNGCPVEDLPEDPTRLFSSNGLTLDLPRIGWIASGVLTVIASIISFLLIYRHLQYYYKPNQQRYIVRMLLMVPIYAITSWFSFVYVREAIYYDTICTLYEAFVIASFLILLLQYLGDSLEEQKRVLRKHKKTERWFFPLCCLKYNPSKPHFLQFMKWGILQYVPLNVLATILTIVLQVAGSYCEGSWNPKFGHVWILMITTTSVTVATYFLIMFYFTIREDLKEYSPFYKFLSVKLVIFFSFWQSVLIEGLVYFGYIKPTTYWSTNDISVGINAVLIDVEMVFFALMHLKAFSYKPYVPLIPNPDLAQNQQPFLQDNDSNDPDHIRNYNNNSSMATIPLDRPSFTTPGGYHSRNQSQQQALQKQRQLQLKSSGNSLSKSKPGADTKSSSSKKGKKGPPEKIMDMTQKTPIWKGLLDSFNPLDTIRELGYGIQYLYRWSRGIPVDKDSRRLLDLEKAFGRQRPEVPYVPTKEELEKEKKKNKKKGKEEKSDDDTDLDSDGKSDHGDDGFGNMDNGQGGTGRGRKGNRDTDRLNEDYGSGPESERNGGDGGTEPRWRMDSTYDMGYGLSSGAGVASLSQAGGRSRPSYATNTTGSPATAVAGLGPQSFKPTSPGSGRGGPSTRKPVKISPGMALHSDKDGVRYLEKEEASRTERATLPDIQLEPIERKVALSGLYEDLRLSSPTDIASVSSSSSLDIPIPSSMRLHQPPLQHQYRENQQPAPQQGNELYLQSQSRNYQPQHQPFYQLKRPYDNTSRDYRTGDPLRGGGGSYTLPQQQQQQQQRLEMDAQPQSVRFEHRDRALEQAAATGPVLAPPEQLRPMVPLATRPLNVTGLTQLENKNFVTKGNPHLQSEDLSDDESEVLATAAAATAPFSVAAGVAGELHHDRIDSTSTMASGIGEARGGPRVSFYHQKEASRSDPELSNYGHDHEHYLERLRFLEDQEYQYRARIQQQLPVSNPREEEPTSARPTQVTGDVMSSEANDPAATEALPIDPIVAEFSQIQYRQQQQQQQQLQQRQWRDDPPASRQQQRYPNARPPPRRRNSLDSLDSGGSDSLVDDIGARRYYGHDRELGYGSRYGQPPPPPQPFQQYDQPKYEPQKGTSRGRDMYLQQQDRRYPMALPQPLPPAQFYRFQDQQPLPIDRGVRDRVPQRDRGGGLVQGTAARMDPREDPRYYNSGPYDDPYGDPRYVPRPAYYRDDDPRYRSRPSPIDTDLHRHRPRPDNGRYYEDRAEDEYYRRQNQQHPQRPESPENMFPASRYAAPFVRDYEFQQREARRRNTQTPPLSALAVNPKGKGPVDRDMPLSPTATEGPYEEAVVWTRPQASTLANTSSS